MLAHGPVAAVHRPLLESFSGLHLPCPKRQGLQSGSLRLPRHLMSPSLLKTVKSHEPRGTSAPSTGFPRHMLHDGASSALISKPKAKTFPEIRIHRSGASQPGCIQRQHSSWPVNAKAERLGASEVLNPEFGICLILGSSHPLK